MSFILTFCENSSSRESNSLEGLNLFLFEYKKEDKNIGMFLSFLRGFKNNNEQNMVINNHKFCITNDLNLIDIEYTFKDKFKLFGDLNYFNIFTLMISEIDNSILIFQMFYHEFFKKEFVITRLELTKRNNKNNDKTKTTNNFGIKNFMIKIYIKKCEKYNDDFLDKVLFKNIICDIKKKVNIFKKVDSTKPEQFGIKKKNYETFKRK